MILPFGKPPTILWSELVTFSLHFLTELSAINLNPFTQYLIASHPKLHPDVFRDGWSGRVIWVK
jgi:hypothetical protein